MLTTSDSAIDLRRFEQFANAGQEMLEKGDATGAAETLGRALGQWRGPALADVAQGELLSSYVTRLEELRLRTLELRIEADLRLGRHRELVSELKSLVRQYTLHEHLHATLMIALYRSGRRHEALEIYRVLRGNMVEDLGLEPGPELKELHQRLLSDMPPAPPLDRTPPREPWESNAQGRAVPSAPAVRASPDRTGPPERAAPQERRVTPERPVPQERQMSPDGRSVPRPRAEVVPVRKDVPAEIGPGAAPANVRPPVLASRSREDGSFEQPRQLPPDLGDLTGRQELIEELAAGFEKAAAGAHTAIPITVITGLPGVGKTALAVHLAHRLRDRFPDGQLYADLHASTGAGCDVAESLRRLLRAVGVPNSQIPDSAEERSTLLRSATAGRRLLLVIDDAAEPAEVAPLLPGDPGCGVIITSAHRMPGLIGGRHVELRPLTRSEGVELLGRVIGEARIRREPGAAERLVELVGGLPLALRCVAGRLATRQGALLADTAEQLERSERPLDLLRLGDLDVRSRLDAGYRRLGRLDKGIFRLLSMLPVAEFTLRTAAELLGWDEAVVEGALDRLADEHLIVVRRTAGELRYAFPVLVLSHARERLTQALEREEPWEDGSGERQCEPVAVG
ncbi:BTAD domain-containing putative transcriptional regulator [Spirillospora sp. NPDC047279]|uniref:BTAD domain-containing putative transcriptional regulator n=1 Tax=Spirillospora sp. NPDC047279 TaxID=3155478 RepID=UPI0033C24B58